MTRKVVGEKKVALVLASGGARGFAHIGAIEALEQAGYSITSIAGTSIGALIGGIYAAGGLPIVKQWMYQLTRKRVFSLADFTLSNHALLKGNRLIDALQSLVPDCQIENLPIPYVAVATDIKSGSEYVFDHGNLYDAIRASISIPMLFKPVEYEDKLLIDGGITNGLPLDRVKRTEGDMLVAVNLDDYKWDDNLGNYVSMTSDTISILMKRNTEMALRLTPPDVYLNVNVGEYGSMDYDRAREIATMGKVQMKAVLKGIKETRNVQEYRGNTIKL